MDKDQTQYQKNLKCSVALYLWVMRKLQNKYKETYKKYFKWNAGIIEAGLNKNYLTTCMAGKDI